MSIVYFLMAKHFRSRVTPSTFHMQNETVSNKPHKVAPPYSLPLTSILADLISIKKQIQATCILTILSKLSTL
jgi:hypothetical protein